MDKPLNKSNFYEQEKTILINSGTNKINKNELLNEDDKTLIERRVIFFDFKIQKIKIEDFKELFSEINFF